MDFAHKESFWQPREKILQDVHTLFHLAATVGCESYIRHAAENLALLNPHAAGG